MQVIATAGHVDHGKSTLVKALTGTDPDRLEEEHRRGLSIELGYCWTTLGSSGDVAFVDVPGHERFLSTMLAGIGPVPAVLFVVAADDPWMPQAAEHLSALDALGVSHGVVAVTRCDLADPGPARERATAALNPTSLRGAPVVTVSGRTGQGLDELRSRLAAMVDTLPVPDELADVRLWVDRRFTIKGTGTVVTGTLPAGRIRVGDSLTFESQQLRVRAVESLEQQVPWVDGVSRAALNVVGDDLSTLERGSVLVTPSAWHFTDDIDVRITSHERSDTTRSKTPPAAPLLHVGAASVAAHCRPLGDGLVRLRLDRRLPLRVGDRALLRDPGSRRLWGVTVLDPAPPPLRRRGAAAERARTLDALPGDPHVASEVERRTLVHISLLKRIGIPMDGGEEPGAESGGWLMSKARADEASREIEHIVDAHDLQWPLDPGVPLVALNERLGLPTPQLVKALVRAPFQVTDGRVTAERPPALPAPLERAVQTVQQDLTNDPFVAPTAERLRELGLDHRSVAAAAKAGRLLRLPDGIVLLPGADLLATKRLGELTQPFTASEARVRLGTTRRVVLPLLAHLDRLGWTRRLSDDRRTVAHDGVS